MKISELQNILIKEIHGLLPNWKFVKSARHFKKIDKQIGWFLHISCINHVVDFDAVADVAIEFKSGKERLCIIGAELGNIEGVGQKRFSVANPEQAKISAIQMYKYFERIGLSFLQKYSDPKTVVATLRDGHEEALLISPSSSSSEEIIFKLSQHYNIGM